MRTLRVLSICLVLALSLVACSAPGKTKSEKIAAVEKMKNDTLQELYRQRPAAKDVLARSIGYAVFSNVSGQYIFFGGGSGYGVAINKKTGKQTYMQMAQVGLGFGLGVQDIRVVFVFHSEKALNSFVDSGWEFGGQADAAAKASEKGGSATGELSVSSEMDIYTMTESGLLAKVNMAGTKYWKDSDLNE